MKNVVAGLYLLAWIAVAVVVVGALFRAGTLWILPVALVLWIIGRNHREDL